MSVTASRYDLRPLTDNSRRIADAAEHALVPVSPYDAYYSKARLIDLFGWVNGRFDRFDVWIPGHEAALGLIARGDSPRDSVRRITKDLGRLSKKVRDVLSELGLTATTRLLDASLMDNEAYRAQRFAATLHFETDADFREDVMRTCRYYMPCKESIGGPSDAQLRVAAGCYLPEVAIMVDTPAVLGVGSSVFCLDEPVPFVEELFHGKFTWQPNPRQGCVLLTPGEDADR